MAELAPSDTPGEYKLGFAGDTFNTAWYLAQIAPEIETAYLTAVGTDRLSSEMRGFVRDSGIDDRHVQVIPDQTIGMYLISLNKGERSFTYWRGQSAAKMLAHNVETLVKATAEADLIYFSGITLAILEKAAQAALLDVLRNARASGKTVVFDPNLRPRLWASSQDMVESIMQGAAVSDIALPSFEDEASWFEDASPQATIARYSRAGANAVIVKNGDASVCYICNGVSGDVAVDALATVVDTTAAGDSFNAGILAGIAAGQPMQQSISQACRLARIVVQRKGALVPIAPNTVRFPS